MKKLSLTASVLCLLATLRAFSASPVVISEFMAANTRTLADEDGDFSDWIELHNPSASAVNLAGYFLTDDPARLTKWMFPEVTLSPGDFLVVFASGKNRPQSTNHPPRLHTNFELDGGGEFLALVEPDGVTFATVFSPIFPPQEDDVAFGTAQSVTTIGLLAGAAPVIRVPTNAAQLPPNWPAPAFAPGADWWIDSAPPAIGFDTNRATGAPANVAPSGTAAQSTTYSPYTPNLAVDGNLGNFTHTLGADPAPFWQVTLTNQTAIYSVVLYNRTGCCGSRLRDITIEILSTNQTGFVTNHTSPLLNPENAGYTYPNGPTAITNDLVAATGGPVLGQMVRVRRTPDPDLSGTGGQGNTDEPAVLSLAEVIVQATAASGLRPYFHTDLENLMWNKNASAFVRLPFVLTNTPDTLTLPVRYDDGFVAFVNGVEIARRNAPAILAWNSSATADRNLASAIAAEVIDVSAAIPQLVAGTNLFAVQVLNAAATNADLLFQPELMAARVSVAPNAYLVDATPGTNNNTDYYFGEVADTRFSVDRGFFDAPFTLEITSATPGAEIYYSFDASEPRPGQGSLYTSPLTITNTSVVRARAFKAGLKATGVDTHTYLFLADVIRQAPTGAAPPYFPTSWGRNRVDYGMDPAVIARYTLAQWREALTQIPTVSIVTEMKNLFDPTTGIYANADGHGENWERPSSIELLDPTNAVPGRFQEPCGLRIRGGYSRNPDFVKHSFRVFFRREYGAGKLHFPLFEEEGANEFDTFDLRTSQNYAWSRETSASSGQHDTMVREVFCRETLGAMGQPYRRSRYYHLYLNGQYWGLYETDERPEASYGETYFGGSKTNYDVVKCANHVGNFVTEATDGNFTAWSNLWTMALTLLTNASDANYFAILGCDPDGTRNPARPVLLEVDNLIDYMLGIFYSGDGDATLSAFLGNVRPNNWFGMRDRTNPDAGFRFFNSDCEHTLGAPSWQADRTGPWKDLAGSNVRNFTYSNPQYFHEELMLNAEYRLRFADHVQKHFYAGGVLTPEAGTNRFLRKAVQINKAMRAYEARWGDGNTARTRYSTADWTNRINTIVNTWFPTRTAVVLAQLKADQLYPATTAPNFSQDGGEITNGFPLVMWHTNVAGTIYYTLDGTDPRWVGGGVSSAALAYSNAIVLNGGTRVKARVRSGVNWSALSEADFVVAGVVPLRITEIMYHPGPLSPAEWEAGFRTAEDFEFIELRNIGPAAISLAGISFVNGISFTFSSGTLAAGERLVLVKSVAAFTNRYSASVRIAGVFGGNLNNAGERLRLQDVAGRTIHDFTYSDEWYPTTDGFGFSLSVVDDTAPTSLWGSKANWRVSSALGGSPGQANPIPPSFPFVVVNELLSRPAPPDRVAVELANLSDHPADLSGWWLTDAFRSPKKFRLPTNTIIAAGGFVVFTEDDFNAPTQGTNAFTFSPAGGEVRLFAANADGDLTGYYQGWDFGAADEGVSLGRHVTSTGADHFVAQTARTFGGTNAGPRVGPLVVTEIQFRPPDLNATDNSRDEFIEVLNIATSAVPLFSLAVPTNTWQLRGGVDLVFPTNLTLGAGQYLLLVNFDPTIPASLELFRALYAVPPDALIVGPYAGKLNNDVEDVELERPTVFATGQAGWVQVEKVSYHDSAPWPAGADGTGASLQRRDPVRYGNDPTNWIAAAPHAASSPGTGTPPTVTGQPTNRSVVALSNTVFTVQASGTAPLRYQWRLNGHNLAGATNASLELTAVQVGQAGLYSVVVFNDAGSALSEEAILTVLLPPQILSPPVDVSVRIPPDPQAAPTTNATFSVVASSPSALALRYQWRFNGVDLPKATNATLTISNVQASDWGEYRVAVGDDVATVPSTPAWLYPLVTPRFVNAAYTYTVVTNSLLPLSVQLAVGYPPPFTWEWRRGSTVIASNLTDTGTDFYTLQAPATLGTTLYRAVVKNLANNLPGVACNINVVTVLDSDGDGLPDYWGTNYFNTTNTAALQDVDSDGDGMSNRQEYLAGTDPTNALSLLQVSLLVTSNAVNVLFGAVSNKTYTVQHAGGLGASHWLKLADVVAQTTNYGETIPDSRIRTNRFYRVVTPRQP